jgi:hypothetical protein
VGGENLDGEWSGDEEESGGEEEWEWTGEVEGPEGR